MCGKELAATKRKNCQLDTDGVLFLFTGYVHALKWVDQLQHDTVYNEVV